MLNEIQEESILSELENNPYTDAIEPLKNGLLRIYEPHLTQIKKALNELGQKESALLNQIYDENLALAENQYSDELNAMFNKIELYQTKLGNIKKDMKSLHDKSIKLKKRALKIQQFKEKQEYVKQQKEADIKMEQDLIGKPS